MQASSFEAVIVPPRRAAYTPLRLVAATAVALALLAAVAVQRSGDIRGRELMQGSDEVSATRRGRRHRNLVMSRL